MKVKQAYGTRRITVPANTSIMSRFQVVEAAPPVEIFALSKAYREDTYPKKVDLGIGGSFLRPFPPPVMTCLLFCFIFLIIQDD